MPRPTRRHFLHTLAALPALAPLACRPADPATLLLLTDLPEPATAAIDRAVRRAAPDLPPLLWLRPAPTASLLHLARDHTRADLVLSARPDLPADLALDPLVPPRPLARPAVGLAIRDDLFQARAMDPPRTAEALADPRLENLIALADPRRDPATLALAAARLTVSPWPAAYAELVAAAALAGPIGIAPTSARAALVHGSAALAPALADDLPGSPPLHFEPLGPAPPGTTAILRQPAHPEAAHAFLDALDHAGLLHPAAPTPLLEPLLALLLGATLVDAQPELVRAHQALRAAGLPADLEAALTEPPPWPPPSVSALKDPALLAALAAELAPDLALRYWLQDALRTPPAPVDAATLQRLASAADGRLLHEPRFASWISAEWTSWARSRYRRVTRRAAALPRTPEPGLT